MTAIAWVLGIGGALFLFVRFPKQMGIAVAILVVLGGAVGGYFWWTAQSADAERRNVIATAAVDPKQCPDSRWPLYIIFRNANQRTVQSVSFYLVARTPGFSSKVVNDFYSYDKIIDPERGWGICWADHQSYESQPASGLEWGIEIISVSF